MDGQGAKGRSRRPRSVGIASALLFVVAVLLLLYGGLNLFMTIQTVASGVGGLPALIGALTALVLPLGIGLAAAVAGVGLVRAAPWASMLGTLVGAALVAVGALLLWVYWSERDSPGSFAVLFVPPGVLAVIIGAVVVSGSAAHRRWLVK